MKSKPELVIQEEDQKTLSRIGFNDEIFLGICEYGFGYYRNDKFFYRSRGLTEIPFPDNVFVTEYFVRNKDPWERFAVFEFNARLTEGPDSILESFVLIVGRNTRNSVIRVSLERKDSAILKTIKFRHLRLDVYSGEVVLSLFHPSNKFQGKRMSFIGSNLSGVQVIRFLVITQVVFLLTNNGEIYYYEESFKRLDLGFLVEDIDAACIDPEEYREGKSRITCLLLMLSNQRMVASRVVSYDSDYYPKIKGNNSVITQIDNGCSTINVYPPLILASDIVKMRSDVTRVYLLDTKGVLVNMDILYYGLRSPSEERLRELLSSNIFIDAVISQIKSEGAAFRGNALYIPASFSEPFKKLITDTPKRSNPLPVLSLYDRIGNNVVDFDLYVSGRIEEKTDVYFLDQDGNLHDTRQRLESPHDDSEVPISLVHLSTKSAASFA